MMARSPMADDPVVITGTGLVCALGETPAEVWEGLLAGRNGTGPIRGFDGSGFSCPAAAQAPFLDPSMMGIHPRDSRIMDTHAFMLMKGSVDAYHNSRIEGSGITSSEIAFFVGMGMVDYREEDLMPAVVKSLAPDGQVSYDAFFSGAYKEIHPLWPLSMLNNISFCQVAIRLCIKGDNSVFSPHADSGAQAIVEAAMSLSNAKSKAALAGGVSEKVSPSSMARAHLAGFLATGGGENAVCRPFDALRRGSILGEGCGIIVLERLSSARQRGSAVHAALTGYGFGCEPTDGFGGPSARAICQAMTEALSRASLEPRAVDVIIANGDGTVRGDGSETAAIHEVFSCCIEKPLVFSSKGALGNLLAGSPAIDVILATAMIREGIVPAICTLNEPDPGIRFRLARDKPVTTTTARILVNCQSYEGQAVSLVVEAIRN